MDGVHNVTFLSSEFISLFKFVIGVKLSSNIFLLNVRMSNNEVLVIFHYDGEFDFDIDRPTYKGGKQEMRYLPTNISYSYLRDVALEESKWEALSDMPVLEYLYHDGFAFSLITLEEDEDEDIKVMFRPLVNKTNGLYLYVSEGTNPAAGNRQEKPM